MELSAESREFIENLRVYLFATGKSEKEIEEIVRELADHLYEAEKRGKSVQNVIGMSPKAYMEEIAREMRFDYKEWTKYGIMIILGFFAFILMNDISELRANYSWIQMIGYPLVGALIIFAMMKLFQFMAANRFPKMKEMMLLGSFSLFSIFLFVAVIILDKRYGEVVIEIQGFYAFLLFLIAAGIFVGLALWSKSWVMIIVPVLLFFPELVMRLFITDDPVSLMVVNFISLLSILVVFIYSLKSERKA